MQLPRDEPGGTPAARPPGAGGIDCGYAPTVRTSGTGTGLATVADGDHGHRAIADGAHHLKAGRNESRDSKRLMHRVDFSVKPMRHSASTSSKLSQSPFPCRLTSVSWSSPFHRRTPGDAALGVPTQAASRISGFPLGHAGTPVRALRTWFNMCSGSAAKSSDCRSATSGAACWMVRLASAAPITKLDA